MTREEFEALLKMQGRWLYVVPEHGSVRGYRKWYTNWLATIQEKISQEDIDDINALMKKLSLNAGITHKELGEEDRIQTVRTARGKTNYQAVKFLIDDYLERVQKRADN